MSVDVGQSQAKSSLSNEFSLFPGLARRAPIRPEMLLNSSNSSNSQIAYRFTDKSQTPLYMLTTSPDPALLMPVDPSLHYSKAYLRALIQP